MKRHYKNIPLETLLVVPVILYMFVVTAFSADYHQDEWNPQGDLHPRIEESESLSDWVTKHCDEETSQIFEQITWYSEYNGIKPEVIFAISWADTNCGRHMATQYNYGNVGNNDRGDRVGFYNAFEGWQAIVDVLSNKYLHGNTTIGQLSQGGRINSGATYSCANSIVPYKCYATSEYNWNKNVKRALSVMLSEDIKENYKFRTK